MDSAPAQSAKLSESFVDSLTAEQQFTELSGLSLEEFRRAARADTVDLRPAELASVLLAIGLRHNYGVPPGGLPNRAQTAAFFRSLHLQDLALAHACALGRDAGWNEFMKRFRDPLARAANAIAGSIAAGEELAGSLYSEMFGLRERDGQRQSPLASYSGRGSLIGFLRAALAQKNVDNHRRANREEAMPSMDFPAAPATTAPDGNVLNRLRQALEEILRLLAPEERFLLSAWFLDQRTLLEISRILRVHEATVSRRVQRLTSRLHDDLRRKLQASGMSRAAGDEALGTDPRDVDLNLRSLLQASRTDAFPDQRALDKRVLGKRVPERPVST